MVYSDGREYRGHWSQNRFHNYGWLKLGSGDEYEGGWSNGKKQGRGSFRFYRRGAYDGEWEADQMHGAGIYVSDASESPSAENLVVEERIFCHGDMTSSQVVPYEVWLHRARQSPPSTSVLSQHHRQEAKPDSQQRENLSPTVTEREAERDPMLSWAAKRSPGKESESLQCEQDWGATTAAFQDLVAALEAELEEMKAVNTHLTKSLDEVTSVAATSQRETDRLQCENKRLLEEMERLKSANKELEKREKAAQVRGKQRKNTAKRNSSTEDGDISEMVTRNSNQPPMEDVQDRLTALAYKREEIMSPLRAPSPESGPRVDGRHDRLALTMSPRRNMLEEVADAAMHCSGLNEVENVGTRIAVICKQVINLEKQLKAVSGSDPQGYAKKKQLQAEKAKLLKEKRGLAAAKAAEGAAA